MGREAPANPAPSNEDTVIGGRAPGIGAGERSREGSDRVRSAVLATAALGVLAFLLSLAATPRPGASILPVAVLLGGTLVLAATLLPGAPRMRVPAAAATVTGGLLGLTGLSGASGLGVVVVVVGMLAAVAAVATVLVEAGVVGGGSRTARDVARAERTRGATRRSGRDRTTADRGWTGRARTGQGPGGPGRDAPEPYAAEPWAAEPYAAEPYAAEPYAAEPYAAPRHPGAGPFGAHPGAPAAGGSRPVGTPGRPPATGRPPYAGSYPSGAPVGPAAAVSPPAPTGAMAPGRFGGPGDAVRPEETTMAAPSAVESTLVSGGSHGQIPAQAGGRVAGRPAGAHAVPPESGHPEPGHPEPGRPEPGRPEPEPGTGAASAPAEPPATGGHLTAVPGWGVPAAAPGAAAPAETTRSGAHGRND